MRKLLSSLAVSSLLTLVACGGAATPAPATPAPAGTGSVAAPAASSAAPTSADLKKPGEAKVGDKTTCPVSGEQFVVMADSPSADYQGKTYYFCCANCVGKFKADPTKYVR